MIFTSRQMTEHVFSFFHLSKGVESELLFVPENLPDTREQLVLQGCGGCAFRDASLQNLGRKQQSFEFLLPPWSPTSLTGVTFDLLTSGKAFSSRQLSLTHWLFSLFWTVVSV